MILLREIKRILSPILLIIIVLFSIIYYALFETQIINFRDRNNFGSGYNVGIELAGRFGSEIDDDEIEGLIQYRREFVEKLDKITEEKLGKYGIHTYKELDYIESNEGVDGYHCEIYDLIYQDMHDIIFSKDAFYLQEIDTKFEFVGLKDELKTELANEGQDGLFSDYGKRQIERLKNCLNDTTSYYLVSDKIIDDFNTAHLYWSILIMIACTVLILPYCIKNRILNVTTMQYSTKSGKPIIKKQLYSSICVGIIVFAVFTAVFQLFYSKLGLAPLLNSRIENTGASPYWFDYTLLQYMITAWIRTFIYTIMVCIGIYIISLLSKNYIVAIISALPVVILFSMILERIPLYLKIGMSSFEWGAALFSVVLLTTFTSVGFILCKKHCDSELVSEQV